METIMELFITFWQANIMIRFLGNFLGYREKFRKSIVIVLGTILLGATITGFNYLTYYESFAVYIYILEMTVIAGIFMKGKWYQNILISFGTILGISLITSLIMQTVAIIGNQSLSEIYSQLSVYRIVGIILIQVMLELLAGMIVRIFAHDRMVFKMEEWAIILLNVTFSLSIMFAVNFLSFRISWTKEISYLILSIMTLVVCINIVLFFLLCRLSESNLKVRENEAIQIKIDYYEKLNEKITEQYRELRRLKHDTRHFEQTIVSLLNNEKYKEAIRLFEEWEKQTREYEDIIKTNDESIDALLNTKFSYAKKNHIECVCNIITGFNGIETSDLIHLLGNLLDNAIEANHDNRIEKKYIELTIAGDDYKIVLQMKNSILESALSVIEQHFTTKSNREEHGYGLKIIRKTVEKYSGKITYREENNLLIADAIMFRNK